MASSAVEVRLGPRDSVGMHATVDFPALWYASADPVQRCGPFLTALRASLTAVQVAVSSSWTEQNEALMQLLTCVQQNLDLLALTTSVTVFINCCPTPPVSPQDEPLTAPHEAEATAALTLGDVVLPPDSSKRSTGGKSLSKRLQQLPLHQLAFPYTDFCATLWLSLDPRYPIGVQRRALEILELYASHIVGEDGWKQTRENMLQQRDFGFEEDDVSFERTLINEAFPLLMVGVLQLLPQCSMQIKSSLLDYAETVLLFLSPTAVMQSVEGILVAVLHLLEEAEGSELHRRGLRILACVRRKASSSEAGPTVGTGVVYAVLWRLLVDAPMLSGGVWGALTYMAQQDHTLFAVEEEEQRPSAQIRGGDIARATEPVESTVSPLRLLRHAHLCGGDPKLVYWGIFYTLLAAYTNGGSAAGRKTQNESRTMKLLLDFLLQYVPLHTFLVVELAPTTPYPSMSPFFSSAAEPAPALFDTTPAQGVPRLSSHHGSDEGVGEGSRSHQRSPLPGELTPAVSGSGPVPLFALDEVAVLVGAAVQLSAAHSTPPNVSRRLLQWVHTATSDGTAAEATATPPHAVEDASFPHCLSVSRGVLAQHEALVRSPHAGGYLIARAFALMVQWWRGKTLEGAGDYLHSPVLPSVGGVRFAGSIAAHEGVSAWDLLQESAAQSFDVPLTGAPPPPISGAASVGARSAYQASFLPSHSSTHSGGTPSVAGRLHREASRLALGKSPSKHSTTGGRGAGVMIASAARSTLSAKVRDTSLPRLWYVALASLLTVGPHPLPHSGDGARSGTANSTTSIAGTDMPSYPSAQSPAGTIGPHLSSFLLGHWSELLGTPLCALICAVRSSCSPSTVCLSCEEDLLKQLGWRWLADVQRSLLATLKSRVEGEEESAAAALTGTAALQHLWQDSHEIWRETYIPLLVARLDTAASGGWGREEPVLYGAAPPPMSPVPPTVSTLPSSPVTPAPLRMTPPPPLVSPSRSSIVVPLVDCEEDDRQRCAARSAEADALFDFAVEAANGLLAVQQSLLSHPQAMALIADDPDEDAADHLVSLLSIVEKHLEDVLRQVISIVRQMTPNFSDGSGADGVSAALPRCSLLSVRRVALRPLVDRCSSVWRAWVIPAVQPPDLRHRSGGSWSAVADTLTHIFETVLSLITGDGCHLSPGGVEVEVEVEVEATIDGAIRDLSGAMSFPPPQDRSTASPPPASFSAHLAVLCGRLLFTLCEARSSLAGTEKECWWWKLSAVHAVPLLWSQLQSRSTGSSTAAQEDGSTLDSEALETEDALEEEVLAILLRGCQTSPHVLAAVNCMVYGKRSAGCTGLDSEEESWAQCERVLRFTEYLLRPVVEKDEPPRAPVAPALASTPAGRSRLAFLAFQQSMHSIFADVHPVKGPEGRLLQHTSLGGGPASVASAPLFHLLRHFPQHFLLPLYVAGAAHTYTYLRDQFPSTSTAPAGEVADLLEWDTWAAQPLLPSLSSPPSDDQDGVLLTPPTSFTVLLRFLAHLLDVLSADGDIPCHRCGNGGDDAPDRGWPRPCWCQERLPIRWWLGADGAVRTVQDGDDSSDARPSLLPALSELLLAVAASVMDRVEQHGGCGSPALSLTRQSETPYTPYLQQLQWAIRGLSSLAKCFNAHPLRQHDVSPARCELLVTPAVDLFRRATRISGLHHTAHLPLCQWIVQLLRDGQGSWEGQPAAASVIAEVVALISDGVSACLQVLQRESLSGESNTSRVNSCGLLSHRSSLRSSSSFCSPRPASPLHSEIPYILLVWRQCAMQLLMFQGASSTIGLEPEGSRNASKTEMLSTSHDHGEEPPPTLTGALVDIWLSALESLWGIDVCKDVEAPPGSPNGVRDDLSAAVVECVEGLSDVLRFVLSAAPATNAEGERAADAAPPPPSASPACTRYQSPTAGVPARPEGPQASRSGPPSTKWGWWKTSQVPRIADVPVHVAPSGAKPTVPLPAPVTVAEQQLPRVVRVLFAVALSPAMVPVGDTPMLFQRSRTPPQAVAKRLIAFLSRCRPRQEMLRLFMSWWLGEHIAGGEGDSRLNGRLKASALLLESFMVTRQDGPSARCGVCQLALEGPLEQLLMELPESSRIRQRICLLLHDTLPSFCAHAQEEVMAFLRCTGYSLIDIASLCKEALAAGVPTASPSGSAAPTPCATSPTALATIGSYRFLSRSALSFTHLVLPSLLSAPTVEGSRDSGILPPHTDPEVEDVETTPITYFLTSVVYDFVAAPVGLHGSALNLMMLLSVLRQRHAGLVALPDALAESPAPEPADRAASPASMPQRHSFQASLPVLEPSCQASPTVDIPAQQRLQAEQRLDAMAAFLLSEGEVRRLFELLHDIAVKKDPSPAQSILNEWMIRVVLELLHLALLLLPRNAREPDLSRASEPPGKSKLPPGAAPATFISFPGLLLTDPARKIVEEHLPIIVVAVLQRFSKTPVFVSRDYRPEAHSINAFCLHFPVIFQAFRSIAQDPAPAGATVNPVTAKSFKRVSELLLTYFSQSLLPALRYRADGSAAPTAGPAATTSTNFFAPFTSSSTTAGPSLPVFTTMLATPFSFYTLTCATMLLELPHVALQQRLYEALLTRAFQPHFFDISPLLLRQLSRLWRTASAVTGFPAAMEDRNNLVGGVGTTVTSFLVGADAKQTAKSKADFLKLFAFHMLSADQRSIDSREVRNFLVALLSARLREYSAVNTLKVMSNNDGYRIIETPEPSRWKLLANPAEVFKTVHVPAVVEVWRATMLLFRCLLWRLEETSMMYLWPVVLPELFHVAQLPFGPTIGGPEIQEAVRVLKLEMLKTVDMAITVCPANFTMFRWIYMENKVNDVAADGPCALGGSMPRITPRAESEDLAEGGDGGASMRVRDPVAPVTACGLLRRHLRSQVPEVNGPLRSCMSLSLFDAMEEEEHYRRYFSGRMAAQRRSPPLRCPWLFIPPSERRWMEPWEGVAFATRVLLQCYPFPALPSLSGYPLRDGGDPPTAEYPSGWTWDADEVRNCLLQDFSNKRK